MKRALGFSGRSSALALLFGAAMGCGASPAPPPSTPQPSEKVDTEEDSGGPAIESEVGALDENRVKQTFERSANKLSDCYHRGAQRLPYLSGDVRFVIRIKKDGGVRWAFVKDSNLGDRDTEECMLGVFKAIS